MEYIMNCWAGCGKEIVVNAPDRQDPQLTEGVVVACANPDCDQKYKFTVDGDGEPTLDSSTSMGNNIDDREADQNTNF